MYLNGQCFDSNNKWLICKLMDICAMPGSSLNRALHMLEKYDW